MDGQRIRVGILDARPIVRAGVAALVDGASGIAVVAELGSIASLRDWSGRLDVVLIDLQTCGVEALAGAVTVARDSGARVAVLSDTASPLVVDAARGAGAAGLVLLGATSAVVIDAIVAAAWGGARAFSVRGAAVPSPATTDPGLSRAERRILALYAAGLKADAVARSVGLSASTVTTYIHRIRRKYERVGRVAGSRVDLYRLALEDGVLQTAESYAVAG